MTIQASIPDFFIRQAADVAKREGTGVDSIIAIALSSQVKVKKLHDTVVERAQRGCLSDLDDVLAAVPDEAPMAGDSK